MKHPVFNWNNYLILDIYNYIYDFHLWRNQTNAAVLQKLDTSGCPNQQLW